MLKNMLGRPGGDLLGLVHDFVTKLRSGSITPKQASLFLRKQNPWSDSAEVAGGNQPISGILAKDFLALLDRFDERLGISQEYQAVVDFMLRNALSEMDVRQLYAEVCPDYRKSPRQHENLLRGARVFDQSDAKRTVPELYILAKAKIPDEVASVLKKMGGHYEHLVTTPD